MSREEIAMRQKGERRNAEVTYEFLLSFVFITEQNSLLAPVESALALSKWCLISMLEGRYRNEEGEAKRRRKRKNADQHVDLACCGLKRRSMKENGREEKNRRKIKKK